MRCSALLLQYPEATSQTVANQKSAALVSQHIQSAAYTSPPHGVCEQRVQLLVIGEVD